MAKNYAVEQELIDAAIDQSEYFGLEVEDSGKSAIRHAYIADVMANGGRGFVDRVRKYGATDTGEPLRLRLWFCELLELLGDLRIPHVITVGCAQNGKTASNLLLLCDIITHGKMNAGWFYASRDSRDLNVPGQFYPVITAWLDRMQTETQTALITDKDTQNSSRYQVDGATAIFSYANTSKPTPQRQGLAAAGGAAVSFTANILFKEERSQWLPGTADPVERRLDASLIPTRPVRDLGTPGGGQGIEVEIDRAHYHFYPHYTCNACGETHPLDPKGCLLRQFRRKDIAGKESVVYLSESGRPVHWWHHDEANPVESAYFGCSNCGHPIDDGQRDESWYQCRKTGVRLRDFLDRPPQTDKRLKVAIALSPLTRITRNNLAAELVRGGIEAMRPEDWQQQALGHPSESSTNSVTIDMIKAAIAAPVPTYYPGKILTIAGVDQGTNEDWLWVMDAYLPFGWEGWDITEVIERSVRVVRFGGDVMRSAIPEKLEEFGVEYGLIDNQPSRSDAARLCAQTCLEMGDQKDSLKDAVKVTTVADGGQEFPCWDIRNEKFLKQVLLNFASRSSEDDQPIYRLPQEWQNWIGMTTERSPVRHLTGPSYDPGSGRWKRGEGNVDDIYYAANFAEAAFYLWLLNGVREVSFGRAGERSSRRARWS
jgi:hypothetical protein